MIEDLHLHTRCSDGVYPVRKVVERAVRMGLKRIAITDHDCLAGIDEARKYCAGWLSFVSGVEFTCREAAFGGAAEKSAIHLLGYAFDETEPALCGRVAEREQAFKGSFDALIASLRDFHMHFAYDDVPKSCGSIMQLRDIAAYVRGAYPGNSGLNDAVKRIFSHASELDKVNLTVEEAMELIHGAGGKAVWAHPYFVYRDYNKTEISALLTASMLEHFADMGLDGAEANYLDFSEGQRAFLRKESTKRGLFTTAGSDFHGSPTRDRMMNRDYGEQEGRFEQGCRLPEKKEIN